MCISMCIHILILKSIKNVGLKRNCNFFHFISMWVCIHMRNDGRVILMEKSMLYKKEKSWKKVCYVNWLGENRISKRD